MRPQSLGERMKLYYEQPYSHRLPMRMPVIIRVDGRAFHTFTRGMVRPYDTGLVNAMTTAAMELCGQLGGSVLAYGQSDEISVLLHNYKKLESQAFFDNEIQKLCSISASIAAVSVSLFYHKVCSFDSRCFVLPEAEVANYFLWRQQDAARNSIQMLAQSLYSPKQLHGKKTPDLNEMCFQKGKNWNDVPTFLKRGWCIKNGLVDYDIPLFNEDRNYIEETLACED